ncbi:hypothetical protein [Alcanivorax sp.]|jgi:hypothetical protein|uniref:hypothetical protein n=1 Tax=Alcanivorax sp. TaxID=1872427 RepID=UPI0032D94CB9
MMWLAALKRAAPYLAVLAVVAGVAFGGWTVRGWYEGDLEAARLKATSAAIQVALDDHAAIAQAVEGKLATLKANETVIDRGVMREVIKPVYRNVCLPAAGVRLLNAAAINDIAGLPTEPDGEVLDGAADTE